MLGSPPYLFLVPSYLFSLNLAQPNRERIKLYMSFVSCEFTDSRAETELSAFHEAVPMCHISARLFSSITSSISLSLIRPLDKGKGRANTMM